MSMSKSEQNGERTLKRASAKDLLDSTQRSERFLGKVMHEFKTAAAGFVYKINEAGEFDEGAARRSALMLAALEGAARLAEHSGENPSQRAHKEIVHATCDLARTINDSVGTMAETLFLTLEAAMILLSNGFQVVQYHFDEEEKDCEEMEKGLVDSRTLVLVALIFFEQRLGSAIEKIMRTSDLLADSISSGEEPSEEMRSKFYSY